MEMKRDDPRIRDLDLVQFETKEYAITLKDKLSKLPEKHFLQCSLLCRVDDIDYLAMEKSYIFPSPAPKHLQLNAIGLIYGAALFAYGVIKGIQTKQNITNALRDTSERFQRFSIIALFKQRDRVRLSQIRWPGVEDVMKILGVNFILMKNDWQVSYLKELEKVSEGLVQMLKI